MRWTRLGSLVLLVSAGGCSAGKPDVLPSLSVLGGDEQSAAPGTAVTIPPSVKITDAQGSGVAGMHVRFFVMAGSGSITGDSAITDAHGIAALGSWTLGRFGINRLELEASAEYSVSTGSEVVAHGIAPTACPCWSTRTPMPVAPGGTTVGVVGGRLYAFAATVPLGGDPMVEMYEPVTDSWTSRSSVPIGDILGGVGEVNGTLYASGGRPGSQGSGAFEAYNPASDSWTSRASIPTARFGVQFGAVNGILYTVGGSDYSGPVATVDAYDPANDRWTPRAPMPTAHSIVGVGVIGGVIYVVGFGNPYDAQPATLEAYDPSSNRWTAKVPLFRGHLPSGVGVVNGVLYAIGGIDPPSSSDFAPPIVGYVQAYDPTTNRWTATTSMPTPRSGMGVGVIDGTLYAIAGFGGPVGVASRAVEAYPP